MTLTTEQAFAQFLVDITMTEYQRTAFIPSRKQSVDRDLAAAFPPTSDLPFVKGILMGSASKNTIVRPLDDIDVLCVFSNRHGVWQDKYRDDSQAFIYRIRQAYSGSKIQQVGTRGQAIRVFYQTGGHVDVAPVFLRDGDVYHLPDGTGGWILTSPTMANAWYGKRNEILKDRLSPVVRLAKAWNRSHSKRFRSFHLETVAGSLFTSLGPNCRENLQKYFEWAPNHLRINDPGGQSGDLSSYLTPTSRENLISALNSAAQRASRAIEAEAIGDHIEAKRLWRVILGSSFPS